MRPTFQNEGIHGLYILYCHRISRPNLREWRRNAYTTLPGYRTSLLLSTARTFISGILGSIMIIECVVEQMATTKAQIPPAFVNSDHCDSTYLIRGVEE
jgi:hypothetical protein